METIEDARDGHFEAIQVTDAEGDFFEFYPRCAAEELGLSSGLPSSIGV
jgi:hypothetical protein